LAQHDRAATSALFVEQAEASVADKTVPKNAARASRRVPGMRHARNIAGPRLRKVSSITNCTIILASLFDVASAKSKFGWYRPSLLTTLPLENHRRKVPVGFGKTRSERRTLQKVATLPVAKTSTTNTSRQSRHQIPADHGFGLIEIGAAGRAAGTRGAASSYPK